MVPYVADLTLVELKKLENELLLRYEKMASSGIKLDMSRGKPAASQLDLSMGALAGISDCRTADGVDARNYGGLDGIIELRRLFADLLGLNADNITLGGNSSLNMMYDTIMRLYVFGTHGNTPWSKLPAVKFICPCPGYDRHFGICEELGIEMIPVPMLDNGPDMDEVERLAAADPLIKGIWCVPLYSNPQGICYSEQTVKRLAAMPAAAPDFRIFWDNAYGVHHLGATTPLANIFDACDAAGKPDRPFYFFSTSKITFPGAGVAMECSSADNMTELRSHLKVQTIGPDKLNQLRTLRFLKNADGVRAHMKKLAGELKPKFNIVLDYLDRELGGTGLASWTKPAGGYFVALDTLDGCAKATVKLAADAGLKMTGAGATFPYRRDSLDRNIRIAPTYPTCNELEQAMKLFCVCVALTGVRKLIADRSK
ncbi:MAG: aminotransferase class I/II-fold pyridoxal phosphate-dependent enzyme [Victivallaceae bacterium]|nr:aminotransferase class I/II-fold pyridoxal phosphate-dependent enzyme [Victivallaceae bacterium]